MSILLQAGRPSQLPGGYGIALLQTLLALAAVCILAWVVLRWSSRRGHLLGRGHGNGRVRVVERIVLDARRSLYLVEVGGKVLLIGAGEGAAPALLTEVDPGALPASPVEPARVRFRDLLWRVGGRSE